MLTVTQKLSGMVVVMDDEFTYDIFANATAAAHHFNEAAVKAELRVKAARDALLDAEEWKATVEAVRLEITKLK